MWQQGVTVQKIATLNDTTRQRVRDYLGRIGRNHPELMDGRLVLHDQPALAPRRTPDHVKNARWQARLDQYTAFLAEHGRQPYGSAEIGDEGRLAHWLVTQRSHHRTGRLSQRRVRALDATVPGWGTDTRTKRYQEAWEVRRAELRAFLAEHGRWPSRRGDPAERSLNYWLQSQQSQDRAGALNPERAAALDATAPGWQGQPRS